MVKSGSRAAAMLWLEVAALSRALDDTSDEEESEDEWEDPSFIQQLAEARYSYRGPVSKFSKWHPERIYSLDPARARRELRVSVSTFKYVLALIQSHPIFERIPGKQEQAPVQLQLEVFLWSLQSLTYYNTAQHYGIGEGSVRKFCDRVLEAVLSLEERFVKWPDARVRLQIKAHVESLSGFKYDIGSFDGTTFKVKYAPPVDPECYFSRKSDYCFNAQVFCDHLRRITFYQLGLPGSVHDKRALSLTTMSENPTLFFEPGEYLFGDNAYGVCFPFIVSPYKRDSSLIHENGQFNIRLARVRIAIEHCLGMVKARFPFLGAHGIYLGVEGATERLCKTQRACFILHNISINQREEPFDAEDGSSSEEEEDEAETPSATPYQPENFLTSEELRLVIQNDT